MFLLPNEGSSLIGFLLVNLPSSSLFFTILFATVFERPATYCNKEGDAVFTFTPTWLTAVSTTNVRIQKASFAKHHVDIVQPQPI